MAENIVNLCPDYRIIIAGGINAKNVFVIYEKIKPFGIDISSGLELNPGIKDPKSEIDVAELFEAYAHEELILSEALGLAEKGIKIESLSHSVISIQWEPSKSLNISLNQT